MNEMRDGKSVACERGLQQQCGLREGRWSGVRTVAARASFTRAWPASLFRSATTYVVNATSFTSAVNSVSAIILCESRG